MTRFNIRGVYEFSFLSKLQLNNLNQHAYIISYYSMLQ